MRRLLSSADFAHALPRIHRRTRGDRRRRRRSHRTWLPRVFAIRGQLRSAVVRGAYHRDVQRAYGRRMTPTGVPTDLYMWQQFHSEPRCRTAGGTRPTVLQFPSPLRHDQPFADRRTELENWSRNLQDPGWRDPFALRVLDRHVRTRAEDTMKLNEELEAHRLPCARLRVSIHAREQ
jgi:hypothetical protein